MELIFKHTLDLSYKDENTYAYKLQQKRMKTFGSKI